MCFSPTADLVGGLVVGVIGVDVLVSVRGRNSHRALAALPLLFAAHQLVESFVWWGTEGKVPHAVGTAALWIYLLFAFVVLPTYVPAAVLRTEPPGTRRRLMAALTLVGLGVSTTLLIAMLVGPVSVRARAHHLAYSTGLRAGFLVVGLYVIVTCGAFIASGQRIVTLFGVVNLAAVAVIAALTVDGFASVWCAWAAVSSAALAGYLRHLNRTGTGRSAAGVDLA